MFGSLFVSISPEGDSDGSVAVDNVCTTLASNETGSCDSTSTLEGRMVVDEAVLSGAMTGATIAGSVARDGDSDDRVWLYELRDPTKNSKTAVTIDFI